MDSTDRQLDKFEDEVIEDTRIQTKLNPIGLVNIANIKQQILTRKGVKMVEPSVSVTLATQDTRLIEPQQQDSDKDLSHHETEETSDTESTVVKNQPTKVIRTLFAKGSWYVHQKWSPILKEQFKTKEAIEEFKSLTLHQSIPIREPKLIKEQGIVAVTSFNGLVRFNAFAVITLKVVEAYYGSLPFIGYPMTVFDVLFQVLVLFKGHEENSADPTVLNGLTLLQDSGILHIANYLACVLLKNVNIHAGSVYEFMTVQEIVMSVDQMLSNATMMVPAYNMIGHLLEGGLPCIEPMPEFLYKKSELAVFINNVAKGGKQGWEHLIVEIPSRSKELPVAVYSGKPKFDSDSSSKETIMTSGMSTGLPSAEIIGLSNKRKEMTVGSESALPPLHGNVVAYKQARWHKERNPNVVKIPPHAASKAYIRPILSEVESPVYPVMTLDKDAQANQPVSSVVLASTGSGATIEIEDVIHEEQAEDVEQDTLPTTEIGADIPVPTDAVAVDVEEAGGRTVNKVVETTNRLLIKKLTTRVEEQDKKINLLETKLAKLDQSFNSAVATFSHRDLTATGRYNTTILQHVQEPSPTGLGRVPSTPLTESSLAEQFRAIAQTGAVGAKQVRDLGKMFEPGAITESNVEDVAKQFRDYFIGRGLDRLGNRITAKDLLNPKKLASLKENYLISRASADR